VKITLKYLIPALLGAWIISTYAPPLAELESWFGAGTARILQGPLAIIIGLLGFWLRTSGARRLVGKFGDIGAELYYPSETAKRPPLSYRLAHYYVEDGRYDEAVAEYERIIGYYPDESPAYLELIESATLAEDLATAEKYRKKYRSHFHEEPVRLLAQEPLPSANASAINS
jgi:tetratricopeptide (TPR) repeat protein